MKYEACIVANWRSMISSAQPRPNDTQFCFLDSTAIHQTNYFSAVLLHLVTNNFDVIVCQKVCYSINKGIYCRYHVIIGIANGLGLISILVS